MTKNLLTMKSWILSAMKNKKESPLTMCAISNCTSTTSPQEPIVLSKKSSSGATSQNHVIFTKDNPHIKSMAAGLLLKNKLMLQDADYIESDYNTWLKFRENYLNKQLELHGDLVCKYCGKPHLEIGGKTPDEVMKNNKNPNLATVDHIIPLSEDGEKYNERNLCVACKKCNREKGNMPVGLFLEKVKKNKILKKL